jgi:adenosylmethionine-8-amino-7-oxononanoate aminotransferase
VSHLVSLEALGLLTGDVGMGTTHAWESFGDNVPPDIQAVAKGLGGGYATVLDCMLWHLF